MKDVQTKKEVWGNASKPLQLEKSINKPRRPPNTTIINMMISNEKYIGVLFHIFHIFSLNVNMGSSTKHGSGSAISKDNKIVIGTK